MRIYEIREVELNQCSPMCPGFGDVFLEKGEGGAVVSGFQLYCRKFKRVLGPEVRTGAGLRFGEFPSFCELREEKNP